MNPKKQQIELRLKTIDDRIIDVCLTKNIKQKQGDVIKLLKRLFKERRIIEDQLNILNRVCFLNQENRWQ